MNIELQKHFSCLYQLIHLNKNIQTLVTKQCMKSIDNNVEAVSQPDDELSCAFKEYTKTLLSCKDILYESHFVPKEK